MKEQWSVATMYAVTPCHAGSGSSLGVVDLPIQRERHTGWPVVPGSGVKGAMRAHFDRFKKNIAAKPDKEVFESLTSIVFGSDKLEHAGALTVSDLKILAFPMRSNVAPFVWVTCPAVIKRFARDLKLAGKADVTGLEQLNNLQPENAWVWAGKEEARILLEDIEVAADKFPVIEELRPYIGKAERLLVVHDEVFSYGVTQCTSITAQIKIDQLTGTTADGSLRYQEELPADTLMYALVSWGDSLDAEASLKMETIKQYITAEVMKDFIQIGGDETCGRGIFEIEWK